LQAGATAAPCAPKSGVTPAPEHGPEAFEGRHSLIRPPGTMHEQRSRRNSDTCASPCPTMSEARALSAPGPPGRPGSIWMAMSRHPRLPPPGLGRSGSLISNPRLATTGDRALVTTPVSAGHRVASLARTVRLGSPARPDRHGPAWPGPSRSHPARLGRGPCPPGPARSTQFARPCPARSTRLGQTRRRPAGGSVARPARKR
jgi:hypothetical protein